MNRAILQRTLILAATATATMALSDAVGAVESDTPTSVLVTNIHDDHIQESSGLAHNGSTGVYTHNDEGESPQVYLVDLATGDTVGTWALSGVASLSDPESMRVDPTNGSLWIADIGDNDGDRSTKRLIQTSIPSSGASTNYDITYPGGVEVNAEALLIHPVTGKKYVATRESVGRLIEYDVSPSGSGTLVYQSLPANISDGTFTQDGRFMLFTSVGQATVYAVEFATGKQVGAISTSGLSKGESITMEPKGLSILLGSEGNNSPIMRVTLPAALAPAASAAAPESSASVSPTDEAALPPVIPNVAPAEPANVTVPTLIGIAALGVLVAIAIAVRAARRRLRVAHRHRRMAEHSRG